MGFEGIGEPIEQGFALAAVVRLLFAQPRQPLALPQLIEPAPPPGPALKHPVQVGAYHQSALVAEGGHPAQRRIGAKGLARGERGGAAAVQLEAFQREGIAGCGWPDGGAAALAAGASPRGRS